jgi:uncharacterized protein YndB with AHSA1/START domain
MSDDADAEPTVRGTCAQVDGVGSVRIEMHVVAKVDAVWEAVSTPAGLRGWAGEVIGDLRVGGEYRALLFPSQWEGVGRVLECEAGRRWRVQGSEPGGEIHTNELSLTADDGGTIVELVETGMHLDKIHYYGVGVQIHVENLAAYLTGRPSVDPELFFDRLLPEYERQAAELGSD